MEAPPLVLKIWEAWDGLFNGLPWRIKIIWKHFKPRFIFQPLLLLLLLLLLKRQTRNAFKCYNNSYSFFNLSVIFYSCYSVCQINITDLHWEFLLIYVCYILILKQVLNIIVHKFQMLLLRWEWSSMSWNVPKLLPLNPICFTFEE